MTIREAINISEIDRIESKILLKYILKKDERYILSNQDEILEVCKEAQFLKAVKEIKKGKPIQYITNKQEFMGLEFYVDENVLIPQPDTEILVQTAIEYGNKYKKAKILDLCTGSGAIAISVKKYIKDAEVSASDISKKALEVANKNSMKNDVQINFIYSNMFEKIKSKYDIIVSNPPYIKEELIKNLPKDVQAEPKLALSGGEDGLEFYRIIASKFKDYLNENGVLILEIGYDQREAVEKLFKGSKCIKDYSGKDRVIIWNHFLAK